MTEKTYDDELLSKLGGKVASCVLSLSEKEKAHLSEIRLRAFSVSSFTYPYGSECMKYDGRPLVLTESELDDIVYSLCGGSLYSHAETLRRGFFTYNGYRIGVSGEFYDGSGHEKLENIRSLNIRIPRFIPDAAKKVFPLFDAGLDSGLLVISRPNMGKTTFLKSAARYISSAECACRKRVLLIDERHELYDKEAFSQCFVDVIGGLAKAKALSIGTRTLSPECAILDEIGDEETADALFSAHTSGVHIVASYHAQSVGELYFKPSIKRMIDCGIFGYVYTLENGGRLEKTGGEK